MQFHNLCFAPIASFVQCGTISINRSYRTPLCIRSCANCHNAHAHTYARAHTQCQMAFVNRSIWKSFQLNRAVRLAFGMLTKLESNSIGTASLHLVIDEYLMQTHKFASLQYANTSAPIGHLRSTLGNFPMDQTHTHTVSLIIE